MHYRDRASAGRRLAASLEELRGTGAVVLGLPRGGVPVAHAVAHALGLPLDIVLVRKLGVPWHPELAMGAIGEGGARVLNEDVIRSSRVGSGDVARVERAESHELERRAHLLRSGRPALRLRDRTAVIVDDGMATGATAAVACQFARSAGANRVLVAVPIAMPEAVRRVQVVADRVVCPYTPDDLTGVGGAYADFHQLADAEVTELLDDRPDLTPHSGGS
ncbi:phosphoribosyltransferase [Rhodococcus triatomae]|uniref:Putative phosphoribosyl transferase n=1 Tax=Rhodococcus triatomae TaxID=300028 RepID=A0A1G7Z5U3_9NOCA|nr:phosphoribosyltransferase family protein [Rhodococcus triatomae]QNG18115.1 phosphoribosyltransferase [Rhodococcus triatomae]QNG22215.1 phosphoribosyltransferase [Rhodococcus triatomae]SDH04054.1 putative phosphoribosyl transferase [Rhodococcus triatomae]